MPRMFKISTTDGPQEVEAKVLWLTVGQVRRRFILHDETLSDPRSGWRIGSINPIKLEYMARLSTYHRITDRGAAQELLNRIVAAKGEAKTLAVMDAAPTLA